MKKIFTLGLAILFTSALYSQNFWEKAPGPQGLNIRQLHHSAQGMLFGTSYDKKHTFRSMDNGVHWTEISGPNGNAFVERLEVGYHGVLFGTDENFSASYFSTDLGDSWQLVPAPFQDPGIFTETADGGYLCTWNGATILRTYDWINYDTLLQSSSSWPEHYFTELGWLEDGRIAAVSSQFGFFISPDNGVSWDTIPGQGRLDDLVPLGAGQFLFFDNELDGLYLSALNAGQATPLAVPFQHLPPHPFVVTRPFLVTPAGEIIVTNGDETFISADQGASWQSFSGNIISTLSHQVLPGGYILKSSSYAGLTARSTDLGINWTFSGYDVDQAWAYNWIFKGTDKAFAFTESGLWRSLDGGAHWHIIPQDSVLPAPRRSYYNLEIAPNGDIYTLQPYLLKYSSDDGETFQNITLDSSDGNFSRVAIHPQTGDVYLSGDSGIIRSADHGQTWQLLTHEYHSSYRPLMFHPSGALFHVTFSATQPSPALTRSDDGGVTWERVLVNPQYNGIENLQIAADGKLVASYGNLIYFSGDNGLTWQKRPAPVDGFTLKLNNTGDAYVANINDKLIFSTKNDGVTWTALPAIPSSVHTGIVDIAFDNQQRLWVCTDGDGHFRTVETTVGVLAPIALTRHIEMFPNPATDGFRIKNTGALGQNTWVVVSDLNGREVSRQTLYDASEWISTQTMPSGMYFVELLDEGHLVGAGKLMVH